MKDLCVFIDLLPLKMALFIVSLDFLHYKWLVWTIIQVPDVVWIIPYCKLLFYGALCVYSFNGLSKSLSEPTKKSSVTQECEL